ncbi:MAG: thioredoxin [Candidatus Woesearchaeota archaeon]
MKRPYQTNIYKFITIIALLFLLAPQVLASNDITVEFYYGDGCPFCERQKTFMLELEEEYPEINIEYYEVYNNPDNKQKASEKAEDYSIKPVSFPITFIGDKHWSGFNDEKGVEIKDHINLLLQGDDEEPRFTVPIFGDIIGDEHSLFFLTLIIAFVDGFNPCSLWVLMFLLGIVIHSGSRKRIFIVGITYLLVTSMAYGLFILGLLHVFAYVSYLFWIRLLVGGIAIGFAMINIKDYFWYKKGISLTISDKAKPGIFKRMRMLMRPGMSIPLLILMTTIMALGITLVELPCTAGFPMVWSQIIAYNEVTGLAFYSLLLLYVLVYLSVELGIFLFAVITLKLGKFEETHGRALKLIGGMIMLFLGIALIAAPDIMNDILGTIALFGGAVIVSIFVMQIYKLRRGNNNGRVS